MWITNRTWKCQHFQCKQNKSFALNWNVSFWQNLNIQILFHSFSVIQYHSYVSSIRWKTELFPSQDIEKWTSSLFLPSNNPLLKLMQLQGCFDLTKQNSFIRKCLYQYFPDWNLLWGSLAVLHGQVYKDAIYSTIYATLRPVDRSPFWFPVLVNERTTQTH